MGRGGLVALLCGLCPNKNWPVYEALLPELIAEVPELKGEVVMPDGPSDGDEDAYDQKVEKLRNMGFELVSNVGVNFGVDPGSTDAAVRKGYVDQRLGAIRRAERNKMHATGGPGGHQWCSAAMSSSYATDPLGYIQRTEQSRLELLQQMDPSSSVIYLDEVVSPHEIEWPLEPTELFESLSRTRSALDPQLAKRVQMIWDKCHQTICGDRELLVAFLKAARAAGIVVHDSAAFTRGDLLKSCQPNDWYLQLEHDILTEAAWLIEMFPPIPPFRGLIHLHRNTYDIPAAAIAEACAIDGEDHASWNAWMIAHKGAFIKAHKRFVDWRKAHWATLSVAA